jgi:DNA-binding response OmpR family regulator
MSYQILVVEPDPIVASVVVQVLTDVGHRVAWVDTFAEGIWVSAARAPDMVIAALRLGAYNGLHLLMHVRTHDPKLAVIIACEEADLTPEIGRFAARHVAKPIDASVLENIVSELLVDSTPRDPRGSRIWPRKSMELAATVHDAKARVVDLSYGGIRLSLDHPLSGTDTPIEIRLPGLGVSVQAVPRWERASSDGGSWSCGAEVALPTAAAARTWRRVVTSLN